MQILAIILQIILGLGFLMFGWMKFTSEQMVKGFEHFGLPQWFRIVTGIFEWIGAVGMIVGIWYTQSDIFCGSWLAIILFFAIVTNSRAKDSLSQSTMAFVLLVLSVVVALIN